MTKSSAAALAVALLVTICAAAAEPEYLKLEFAPEFSRDRIWIRAVQIGTAERQWPDSRTLIIPVQEQNGKRLDSARVLAYGVGCQLVAIEFVPPPGGSSSARVDCVKLATIPLKGAIVGLPRPAGMSIWVLYQAPWSHPFMGIMDGMVFQAKVAETTVEADGRFEFQVPDFANDPVHIKYGDAKLSIVGTYEGRTVIIAPENQPPNTFGIAIQRECLNATFLAR